MAARLRVAYDATPLFGPRTGVGVYTYEVLARLAAWQPVDAPKWLDLDQR